VLEAILMKHECRCSLEAGSGKGCMSAKEPLEYNLGSAKWGSSLVYRRLLSLQSTDSENLNPFSWG